jgi:hypothetical protein
VPVQPNVPALVSAVSLWEHPMGTGAALLARSCVLSVKVR